MKRFCMFACLVLSLGILIGCPDSGSAGNGDNGEADLTLGVIPKSTGGEFWETVEQGSVAASKKLGVAIKWEGTLTETEIAEQNKIIENMINLGVDGMALAPLNKQAQAKMVKQATDAGIPVVIFDSQVDGEAHVSFIATDNKAVGKLGGEHMVKLLGGEGKVMVQRFVQGTGSTEARAAGFIEAAQAGGLEIVADIYPEDGSVAGSKKSSSNTLEGMIEDDKLELDGLFACNLYSALGALEALDDLRKGGVEVNVKYIGFDSSPKLVKAVQNGEAEALVVQNPRKMGYLAVETLTKHLRGEEVPDVVDTGVELVTKKGLEESEDLRKLVGLE